MAPQPDDDEGLLGDSRWAGFLAFLFGLCLVLSVLAILHVLLF